jgi:hypothetical protein
LIAAKGCGEPASNFIIAMSNEASAARISGRSTVLEFESTANFAAG